MLPNTKRLSNTGGYVRPQKTFQDNLSNAEIKEKLKDYKKVDDIRSISIGTHLRYFTIDKAKNKVFRLGGNLNKVDPEGRFVILNNGTVSWSVQIVSSQFWQKMSEAEYKDEIKKEIKKELVSENFQQTEDENNDLRKQLKNVLKKLDDFKELEKKYTEVVDRNKQLSYQLKAIEDEIKKEKRKNK